MVDKLAGEDFKIDLSTDNFKKVLFSKSVQIMTANVDKENYLPIIYVLPGEKDGIIYVLALSLNYNLEFIYLDGHVVSRTTENWQEFLVSQIDVYVDKLNNILRKSNKTEHDAVKLVCLKTKLRIPDQEKPYNIIYSGGLLVNDILKCKVDSVFNDRQYSFAELEEEKKTYRNMVDKFKDLIQKINQPSFSAADFVEYMLLFCGEFKNSLIFKREYKKIIEDFLKPFYLACNFLNPNYLGENFQNLSDAKDSREKNVYVFSSYVERYCAIIAIHDEIGPILRRIRTRFRKLCKQPIPILEQF